MIRTPDVPTRPKKEFDPEEFEKEKEWLKRKTAGKIETSTTNGGWLLYISTALLIAFIIGGSIGALLAAFLMNFPALLIPPIIVFILTLYFFSGDFATVEVDPGRNLLFYEGAVRYAGEYRSIRYRGSAEVIEGTQVVRFIKLFFKGKPHIRFITRSGYLRVNYLPEEEEDFLMALETMSLIDLAQVKEALKTDPIQETDRVLVYYEKKFDRSEYFLQLKKEREEVQREKDVQRRIKRQQVLQSISEEEGQSDKVEMEGESTENQ